MLQRVKNIISQPVDWFMYTILSEKQRKNIGDIFSERQKNLMKKLLHGKQNELRQKLKQIRFYLYGLGFTKRGLYELEHFYTNVSDPSLRRLAAWELVLWHANKYTSDGATQALNYIPTARYQVKDVDQLRRIAIIEAECLDILNKNIEGRTIIEQLLKEHPHPDLFLAAANQEETVHDRLKWINKAMDMYNIKPLTFISKRNNPSYDDIRNEAVDKKIETGPKVSIIIPAFKAEEGIRTAIESMLSQTWQNIELLVVDDCSPDQTAEVIKGYVEQDSRVKLFSTPVNSGPYVARNIALKEASGEYVTINDSDDWSHEEKIEKQVKHLINNPNIIANTSEHARLTEGDLKLYRRGTPGRYIFPNMSSIMFRREPVKEKIGFWDSVRFAADGEFKRRLIQVFGKDSYVDLQTGPLSFPRQSVSSLTGSSAFGYNGYFKGVRREYVDSLENYHKQAKSLYYPYPQTIRPFPVPEPMWPNRENKIEGKRVFDVVIASDFRVMDSHLVDIINQNKSKSKRIGFIQMHQFDLNATKKVHPELRNMIDGDQIHMLVFGEKISSDDLIVLNPLVLEEWQTYIPEVHTKKAKVIVTQAPKDISHLKKCSENMKTYFGTPGKWYAFNENIRESMRSQENDIKKVINLADENWENC
ncbi:glycosyltransferase [Virgibacillus halodenitrificans]|nr:glycosyltransferase [Virgibacillus halodenitrificans]